MKIKRNSFHYNLLDETFFTFYSSTKCDYYIGLAIRYFMFVTFVYGCAVLGLCICNLFLLDFYIHHIPYGTYMLHQ